MTYLKLRNYEVILYPENQEHINVLSTIMNKYKYAYILHDKDRTETGELKKEHWHVLIFLDNQQSLSAFSKSLDLQKSTNLIQFVKDKKQAIRYLLHVDNDDKERYDLSNIISNIDIAGYFDVKQADEGLDIDMMIDFIENYEGLLSYKTFFKFIRDCNIWTTYRRNQYAMNKLVDEHNSLIKEEILPIFLKK